MTSPDARAAMQVFTAKLRAVAAGTETAAFDVILDRADGVDVSVLKVTTAVAAASGNRCHVK